MSDETIKSNRPSIDYINQHKIADINVRQSNELNVRETLDLDVRKAHELNTRSTLTHGLGKHITDAEVDQSQPMEQTIPSEFKQTVLLHSKKTKTASTKQPALAETLVQSRALKIPDEAIEPTPDQTIDHALDQTLAQVNHDAQYPDQTLEGSPSTAKISPLNQTTRQTSLPRVVAQQGKSALKFDSRTRYQKVTALGEGGMGDVVLVQDDDIDRKVAMKRLKRADSDSLLRFIEEIRTIGKLEHPNIVPIHDVGVEPDGSYFFIMKHIEGETLEDVIEKLKAGDLKYHQKYSYDARIQLFLSILNAISFAHAQDIIHRDIKPANIMIGLYGEVTVMDWGLAKYIGEDSTSDETNTNILDMVDTLENKFLENAPHLDIKQRLKLTQQGELLGTPAYMSPEQAEGRIDEVDKRTDTYALSVVFHELMSLTHYLEDKKSLITMLHGVIHDEPQHAYKIYHPNQKSMPPEVSHYLKHGLKKSLDERYQSTDEMIYKLHQIMDGTFAVECPATFMKRSNHALNRVIDAKPMLSFSLIILTGAILLSTVAFTIYSILNSTIT